MKLIVRLRDSVGLHVTVRELFDHPTLSSLTALTSSAHRTCLVSLRPDGATRPLFVVHSGRGDANYGRDLLPGLDRNIPMFGIAATGFREGEVPLADVESMARHNIGYLRTAQPHGPYRLLGYSFGGVVAYEMARQLEHDGQVIEFLGLLDAHLYFDVPEHERPTEGAYLAGWVEVHFSHLVEPELIAELAQLGSLHAAIQLLRASDVIKSDDHAAVLERQAAVMYAMDRASYTYEPETLSIPTTLFVARDGKHAETTTRAWKTVLGRWLTVVPVSGSHDTILQEPHITTITDELSRSLAEHLRHEYGQTTLHAAD